MPQLKFAPDMCIFLLASFFMTQEVLACFSDSECFYHFLFMCLICIGECVSVMEKILVMNIKTSMNSLCILRPIVLSILVQTSLYPGNIRAMLSNFLRVPCTLLCNSVIFLVETRSSQFQRLKPVEPSIYTGFKIILIGNCSCQIKSFLLDRYYPKSCREYSWN